MVCLGFCLCSAAETVIQNTDNTAGHGDVGKLGDDEKTNLKMAGGSEVTGGIRKVQMDKKEAKKLGKSAAASNDTPPLSEKGLASESHLLDPAWQ